MKKILGRGSNFHRGVLIRNDNYLIYIRYTDSECWKGTDNVLNDYKFFCFDGRCKYMFVATDRHGEHVYFDFFDIDFNHLNLRHGHPNAQVRPHKPIQFEKMIELSEKLSKGIPHVRVDFYETNNKIYFGEITFFHHGGWMPFDPPEWDLKFGNLIDISKVKS